MFTVLRFISQKDSPDSRNKLAELGKGFNKITKGIYKGIDKVGGRFSLTISDSSNWLIHQKEILHFLEAHSRILKKINHTQITIQFDIALEPEDRLLYSGPYISLDFEKEFLSEVVENGIQLTATLTFQNKL